MKSKLVSAMKPLNIAVAATLLLSACTTPNKPAEVSSDGLDLIHASPSTVAYKKEGVDFSEFDKLVILPSTVAFRKDWKRNYNQNRSMSSKVTDEEMVQIRENLAALFDKTFVEEFRQSERFTVIDKPQVGSLFIKPAIINLEVNAPDLAKAPTNRQLTRSAGQGTIYLEIFDGVSGEVLARIIDAEKAGSDSRFYRVATRATNIKDATLLVEKWSKALRLKFDSIEEK